MQLEDAKTITPTATVSINDLMFVAPVDSRTPKAITVLDFLTSLINELPTSDPGQVGALWVDDGVLSVSQPIV